MIEGVRVDAAAGAFVGGRGLVDDDAGGVSVGGGLRRWGVASAARFRLEAIVVTEAFVGEDVRVRSIKPDASQEDAKSSCSYTDTTCGAQKVSN